MRQLINIYTPGGNIGCHQHPQAAVFKITQCILACILRFVTMNSSSGNAGAVQDFYNLVCPVLGSGKNQGVCNVAMVKQV